MAPSRAEPLPALLHDPQRLLQAHPLLATASAVVVGYSGGLDSTVLLHLMQRLHRQGLLADLRALHVHHGLQQEADAWEAHCRQVCAGLALPFTCVRLPAGSGGAEAVARQGRYRAFADHLPSGGVLVQAHHRQDQMETVLFRLLRGSGVKGLAGMPQTRPFAGGHLLRPLLTLPREALQTYANAQGLTWVEDPSNAALHYSRNFLRNAITPRLRERWPGVEAQVALSAAHCAESAALLEEIAAGDAAQAAGPRPDMLRIAVLQGLSPARRSNLLRWWWQRHNAGAPVLGPMQLRGIEQEVLGAADDAVPLLRLGENTLGRYRGHLYCLAPLPRVTALALVAGESVRLPAPLGTLSWRRVRGGGLRLRPGEALTLRFRQTGEAIKPAGRPRKTLKKLLQERGVEPWLRDYVPLLYRGATLLAVADFALAEQARAGPGEIGLQPVWDRPELHCGA